MTPAEKYLEYLVQTSKNYPRRFTRGQKRRFLEWVRQELEQMGYHCQIRSSKSGLLRHESLETTSTPEDGFVIMAHYDTPGIMPLAFGWIFRIIGHTRQVAASLFLLGLIILVGVLDKYWVWGGMVELIFWLTWLTLFIPNPVNANDNTSGVLGLLYLAYRWRDHPQRDRVQFVIMDNEENFLSGARSLRQTWEQEGRLRAFRRIISLDCIGRGRYLGLIHNGPLLAFGKSLVATYEQTATKLKVLNLKQIPLNDNFIFRDLGAILLVRLNKSWWPGGFFVPHIHSPLDFGTDQGMVEEVVEPLVSYLEQEISSEGTRKDRMGG